MDVVAGLSFLSCIIQLISLPFIYAKKDELLTWVIPAYLIISIVLLICVSVNNSKFKRQKNDIKIEYGKKQESLISEYSRKTKQLEDDYADKSEQLVKREGIRTQVINSKTPFKDVAIMAADIETFLYEKDERYLRYKSHPATSAADKIKEIKNECKDKLSQYKEIKYKYEFILKVFPEIKCYVENEYELLNIAEYCSYSQFQDDRDKSRDYLDDEEWEKLTVAQRNQLALDRYIQKRNKSSWAIGRDYEMACADSLRKKGYSVEMYGIEKRLGDLGRDLIAKRFDKTIFESDFTKGEVLVIQCKCWNKDFPVRENVLMQLFGTTVAYQIENKKILGDKIKITPVLMVPSFTKLSDMAVSFAEMLGIRISNQEFVEFPRIKCNINGRNKIYHLPFDQQYDTAQIKNEGEFYALTVTDAESKGFRRAMRHQYN
ncbi:MAG: restriction endonuclease [Muribaculaceae bacterium]